MLPFPPMLVSGPAALACYMSDSLRRREEARLVGGLRLPLVADLVGNLFHLSFIVSRLVVKDNPGSANRCVRLILHGEFDFEVISRLIQLEIVLPGLDDPHVVFIGLLALATDVRGYDDVLGFSWRGDMHSNDDHFRMFR